MLQSLLAMHLEQMAHTQLFRMPAHLLRLNSQLHSSLTNRIETLTEKYVVCSAMQPQEKQQLSTFDAAARHRVADAVRCNVSQVRTGCCCMSPNNNNYVYMFQHILLGMCGTSPISPGRLVLRSRWTPDVQLVKACDTTCDTVHC